MSAATPEQSDRSQPGWAPFDQWADRYDAWFETDKGRRIYDVEIRCLRDLMEGIPRPWLEIGAGTGRFATALGVDEAIEPSDAALKRAVTRGVPASPGRAEALPLADGRFGAVLMVVTLCFLENPAQAFQECRRVLRQDGYAVIGMVPKDSLWGQAYIRKGAEGNPFYSAARFHTTHEVIALAGQADFRLERASSCLFEHPDEEVTRHALPREGMEESAGFVAMRFGMRQE